MSTPDAAALEYRRMMQAREKAALARYKALAGSKTAYNTRLSETEALTRDEGWDPTPLLTEEERDALGN